MLDPDTIRLGYQLILDRAPSPAEVSAGQAAFADTGALRQAFLKSREFHRKFSLISQAAEDARIPALVQLMIPGTGGAALRDQLLAHPGLQQAFELDDPRAEALRQMPPGDQRALRYVYGDLSYGVGAGLRGRISMSRCWAIRGRGCTGSGSSGAQTAALALFWKPRLMIRPCAPKSTMARSGAWPETGPDPASARSATCCRPPCMWRLDQTCFWGSTPRPGR